MYDKMIWVMHQEGRGQLNAIEMVDLNSSVGKGSSGLGKINERSMMLINFCKQLDLVVMNTWFKKRK